MRKKRRGLHTGRKSNSLIVKKTRNKTFKDPKPPRASPVRISYREPQEPTPLEERFKVTDATMPNYVQPESRHREASTSELSKDEKAGKPPTDMATQDPGAYRSADNLFAAKVPSARDEEPEETDEKSPTREAPEPHEMLHGLQKDSEAHAKGASGIVVATDTSVQLLKEPENEVQTLQTTLRADRERWERELEKEREGRKQDRLDAQFEIDQLDAEIANLHREYEAWSEATAAKLKEERALRIENERRAEELQTELESRLEESEAEKQTLEEALLSEKEKTCRLETDKRLLDEVKRLLGAAEAEEPSEPDKGTAPENVTEDKTSGELLLKTPFGQVSFLPPFPLNEQEVELLRLIAREDELTGEQIQKQTGRRRAHPDFEYLLERLADEGVKLVEEVSEVAIDSTRSLCKTANLSKGFLWLSPRAPP